MPTHKATPKQNQKNSRARLEPATTALTQSLATLAQSQALLDKQIAQIRADIRAINAETRKIRLANAERFARIEQLLLKQELMLQELPEAVCQKIGFQQK